MRCTNCFGSQGNAASGSKANALHAFMAMEGRVEVDPVVRQTTVQIYSSLNTLARMASQGV